MTGTGERIVSSEWLAASLEPRTSMSWPNPEDWDWQVTGYGYQWWLGEYEFRGERLETWVAWGYGGQWVVAVPDRGLVVAINSNGFDGRRRRAEPGSRTHSRAHPAGSRLILLVDEPLEV